MYLQNVWASVLLGDIWRYLMGIFLSKNWLCIIWKCFGGINLLFPLSFVMKGVSLGFNLCDHSHIHHHCVGHYPMQFHLLLIYILGPPPFFPYPFQTVPVPSGTRHYINNTETKHSVKANQSGISLESKWAGGGTCPFYPVATVVQHSFESSV